MKKIFKLEWLVIIAFFIFILALFLNYSSRGIINLGDVNYPIDLKYYLEKFGYAWQYSSSVGKDAGIGLSYNSYFLIIILLKLLGFSIASAQAVSYALLYFFSFLFMYLLLRISFKQDATRSLLASFFYVLNPFFLAQWYVPIPWNFSVLVVIPLASLIISLFWQRFLELFFLLFLVFLIFSYSSANIPMLLVMFLGIFSFLIIYSFFVENRLNLKKLFGVFSIILTAFLAANLWWLLSPIFSISSIYNSYTSSIDVAKWVKDISSISSLFEVMSLRFVVPLKRSDLIFIGYLPFFFTKLFDVLSFFFTSIIFLSPIFLKKIFKIHHALTYLLLFVLIFLTKALNSPGENVFLFMLNHVPYFKIFKSAPEKFGVLYLFLFSLLIALVMESWKQKSKNVYRLINFFMVIVLIMFAYPLYSGKIISSLNIDGMKMTPFYKEPREYTELRNYLNDNADYSRVLYFNGTTNYMVTNNLNNGYYIRGLDPTANNTNKAFIQPFNYEYNLGTLLIRNQYLPDLYKILPLYDTDFVLFNGDSKNFDVQTALPDLMEVSSLGENYTDLGKRWGNLRLFQVKDEMNMPKIYFGKRKLLALGPQDVLFNLPEFDGWKTEDTAYIPVGSFLKGKQVPSFDDVFVKGFQELGYRQPKNALNERPVKFTFKIIIPVEGNYDVYRTKSESNYRLQYVNSLFIKKGEQEIDISSDVLEENVVNNYQISNLAANSLYELAIDYKNAGDDVSLKMVDKSGYIEIILPKTKVEGFVTHSTFFVTPSTVSDIKIEFSKEKNQSFDYQNIVLSRIFQPQLVLKLTDQQEKGSFSAMFSPPEMTFYRINPTKYKINISGAINPYTLVFSEGYNDGWKAYILDKKKDTSSGGVIGEYNGGKIKEVKSESSLVNRYILETWGKPSLPEQRHLLVNGFANSWDIYPEDAGGKTDYDIVLEYRPQRTFYLGALVTIITFFSSLTLLMVKHFKNEK